MIPVTTMQSCLSITLGTWRYLETFMQEMSKPMAEVMKKAIFEMLVSGLDLSNPNNVSVPAGKPLSCSLLF